MQRALLAALLVGLTAPTVGIYLVQRRLALIGDGLGHVALAGVAIGVLTSQAPVLIALIFAVGGALALELIRARGRTSGDVALAIMFYGGIAGGVVIISQAPGGTPGNLNAFLFGAITTTTGADVAVFALLCGVVLLVTLGLSRYLFAVSNDEEYALASGLPVLRLNLLLVVVTAMTVVVSMRVIGLLLISALMILPIAAAQLIASSFRQTVAIGVGIGVVVSVSGVTLSYYADTPSGGTIVLLAIGVFSVVALVRAVITVALRRRGSTASAT
ncbi:MAG: metal ABC transporter permease [Geodermatophilaceae bacterium]|nr:metal ABC transporter permease [Geodermatophilaceae bacterium]